MGALRLGSGSKESAVLSPQFSLIVSNVMSDMKIGADDDNEQVMKLMYFSLLIYMSENLKMPKSFMIALGNDLEQNRESMESGELVTRYASILTELWGRNKQQRKG